MAENRQGETAHERLSGVIAAVQARGGGGGGLALFDAHDLQLVGDALTIGFEVAKFLALAGGEVDRFALRGARHAGAFAFEDRFPGEREDRALAAGADAGEDDPRVAR